MLLALGLRNPPWALASLAHSGMTAGLLCSTRYAGLLSSTHCLLQDNPSLIQLRAITKLQRFRITAVFIIIEPVDEAGAGRLLVVVLPVRLYRLRRINMRAAHDRVNVYDTRC
jgi:hypothetical protein